MLLQAGQRYPLVDPEAYDNEFGKGFRYAEPARDWDTELLHDADCFITDVNGKRHPGFDCPVPVRHEDLDLYIPED